MTYIIKVDGIVQGIGFRPFIAFIAEKFNIKGEVYNSGGAVTIILNADIQILSEFIAYIKDNCPFGGEITNITFNECEYVNYQNFSITKSNREKSEKILIPIDFPLCEKCKNELYNVSDRRYKYPFISCVSCGPRYSIIKELPYDRENTTMEDFEMCKDCAEEYSTATRRRQAQTISCHECGPQLLLNVNGHEFEREEAFTKAIEIIKCNGILAVKGIGGYHFVCNPFSEVALEKLRRLKARDFKPFAVMFNSIEEIEKYCDVSNEERKLLQSVARPIVLLRKKESYSLCYEVSGESIYLGAFLSSAPLHELILNELGPLVFTSANISSNPIIYKDKDIFEINSDCLSGVLYNVREIFVSLDDSVSRIVLDKSQIIRRTKGYVPTPISFKGAKPKCDIFCAGGDLKASFGLLKKNDVYLSQYFGDLENYEVFERYKWNYNHMCGLFNISPKVVVTDIHPQYFSTRFAEKLNLKQIKVQHHHAHIASVMAENNMDSEVIGIAFDGTGYGDDGCIWGGEVLICGKTDYRRIGHLSYTKMCGGDNSSKDASLSALCYLHSCGIEDCSEEKYRIIKSTLDNDINTHLSSSFGRLFDAVAYLTDIKKYNTYEGECAITLENYADYAIMNNIQPLKLEFEIFEENGCFNFRYEKLINSVLMAKNSNVSKYAVALGFHLAVVELVVNMSLVIKDKYNISKVALSGGVFQNKILVTECVMRLNKYGFKTFLNRAVPTNDGGIALGQAYIASNILERDDF